MPDEELEAIRAHYERMDPKPKKQKSAKDILFDELYREYGDDIEHVLCPLYTPDFKVWTENEVLAQHARRDVVGKFIRREVNFLGYQDDLPKKERIAAAAEVYLANLGYKGDTNVAAVVVDYFGVSRATLFRAVKKLQEQKQTDTPISGDWGLKEFVITRNVVPWFNPDDYGSRKGVFQRAHESRSLALRKNETL